MGKGLLIAGILLCAASAQAGQEWRTEPISDDHKLAAQHYFTNYAAAITCEDIKDMMKVYPELLECNLFAGNTIVHLVAQHGNDSYVLRYLLGFSPTLTIKNDAQKTALELCTHQELRHVFDEYLSHPWRHSNNVFVYPPRYAPTIPDDEFKFGGVAPLAPFVVEEGSDDVSSEVYEEPSFGEQNSSAKILSVIGCIAFLIGLYRYTHAQDEKKSP